MPPRRTFSDVSNDLESAINTITRLRDERNTAKTKLKKLESKFTKLQKAFDSTCISSQNLNLRVYFVALLTRSHSTINSPAEGKWHEEEKEAYPSPSRPIRKSNY